MRTLFLCSNSSIEASMRFRVLQFLEPLRAAGHEATVSSFFDDAPGSWHSRVARGSLRRSLDLVRARSADRLFIHREAFPLAFNDYVRGLSSKTPLIFDFDDAVFLRAAGGWRARLARPESTRLLVERAAVVFAGSEFLAEYADGFSKHVRLVPTVVDTDRFTPALRSPRERPVVGWVGSPTTAKYLDALIPALDAAAAIVPFTLRIVGAGRPFKLEHAPVENVPWTLGAEASAFQDLDVGIYPLADDAWSRGKCGFKAIQYMACGVPFVVSPVGAIHEIVREGLEGLWARTSRDWTDHLVALLRDPSARDRLIANARLRAVERYSVTALAPAWVRALENPAEAGAGNGPLTRDAQAPRR